MIYLHLGPKNCQTEFTFEPIKKVGNLRIIGGRLGRFDRIGVYFSGGLDSTALLCLLLIAMRDADDKLPITCFTHLKNDGVSYYAQRMLEKIKSMFGVNITHTNNIENPHVNKLPSFLTEVELLSVLKQHPKTAMYTGINRPSDRVANFRHKGISSFPDNPEHMLGITAPFLTLNKIQTLDIYYKMNLESLIPYTHSCMMDPISSCNDCYSCEERAWAFNELGKVDPGTIVPDVSDITYNGSWIYR